MLGAERLELGNERELAAERELGIDPFLDRREPQLLEPLDLHPRERLELEVGERAAVPERLRGAQRLRRRGGITRRERLAPDGHESLEAARGRARPARREAGSRERERRAAARPPLPGASTLRSRETWFRSAWSAELRLCSAKSSPISRSRETTRFALKSSSASSARCFGPPIGTAMPSTRTASGPRIRNSRRARCHRARQMSSSCSADTRGPGPRWDSFGTCVARRSPDALHGQVLLARRDRGRATARGGTGPKRCRRAANGLQGRLVSPCRRACPLFLRSAVVNRGEARKPATSNPVRASDGSRMASTARCDRNTGRSRRENQ